MVLTLTFGDKLYYPTSRNLDFYDRFRCKTNWGSSLKVLHRSSYNHSNYRLYLFSTFVITLKYPSQLDRAVKWNKMPTFLQLKFCGLHIYTSHLWLGCAHYSYYMKTISNNRIHPCTIFGDFLVFWLCSRNKTWSALHHITNTKKCVLTHYTTHSYYSSW